MGSQQPDIIVLIGFRDNGMNREFILNCVRGTWEGIPLVIVDVIDNCTCIVGTRRSIAHYSQLMVVLVILSGTQFFKSEGHLILSK